MLIQVSSSTSKFSHVHLGDSMMDSAQASAHVRDNIYTEVDSENFKFNVEFQVPDVNLRVQLEVRFELVLPYF